MLGSYILITALSGSFAETGSKAVGIAVSISLPPTSEDALPRC